MISLSGLEFGGNCVLAFQDYKVQKILDEADKKVRSRKMTFHGHAIRAVKEKEDVSSAFQATLDNQTTSSESPGSGPPVQSANDENQGNFRLP